MSLSQLPPGFENQIPGGLGGNQVPGGGGLGGNPSPGGGGFTPEQLMQMQQLYNQMQSSASPTTTTTTTTAASAIPTWGLALWVVVGLCIIAIIAISIYFCLRLRRNQVQNQVYAPAHQQQMMNPQYSQSETPSGIDSNSQYQPRNFATNLSHYHQHDLQQPTTENRQYPWKNPPPQAGIRNTATN